MCGFVGFLGGATPPESYDFILRDMAGTLSHRGPDDSGYWHEIDHRIGLGHKRLAVIDLSPAGHQPMVSRRGRYVLVFNGEIYNHLELRKSLDVADISWSGHSDTETLLAGFEIWGIQSTINHCIGMFAFAVWDRYTRTLTLARDRMGEKPLYYGYQGPAGDSVFLFGSELCALRSHPEFSATVDRGSLALLLRHNYIPAPYSIYDGISKLEPGCLMTVKLGQPFPEIIRYWSMDGVARSSSATKFSGSPEQAIDTLDLLLTSAVKNQMVADVPLGAFLSGGVDSSTVVALMQTQSNRPIKTFTVGFEEEGYNEAVYAKAIATHLGTEHTELYVSSQHALDLVSRLPKLYCEPFSDSSQIPTFLVSQLAAHEVKVSLSGDGGDELFCGYNRYVLTDSLWRKLERVPIRGRRLAARALTKISPSKWDSLSNVIQAALPSKLHVSGFGDKVHKAADVLTSPDVNTLYLGLVSNWNDPAAVVIEGKEHLTILTGNASNVPGLGDVERMMLLDATTYLPDDILVKLDRAAMGVSLEGRVPFLDHRVVEFAWSLPQDMKLRDGMGKWVLREVLYRHLPKNLIERPKMGFGVPIGEWLRGPLRDWADNLLDETRLTREGYFHPAPIRHRWLEHLAGQRNWHHHLWSVLMFQAWLEDHRTTKS